MISDIGAYFCTCGIPQEPTLISSYPCSFKAILVFCVSALLVIPLAQTINTFIESPIGKYYLKKTLQSVI